MIDRFLAGSICHAVIGGENGLERVSGRGQGSRGGSIKSGGSDTSGWLSEVNSEHLFTSVLLQMITDITVLCPIIYWWTMWL